MPFVINDTYCRSSTTHWISPVWAFPMGEEATSTRSGHPGYFQLVIATNDVFSESLWFSVLYSLILETQPFRDTQQNRPRDQTNTETTVSDFPFQEIAYQRFLELIQSDNLKTQRSSNLFVTISLLKTSWHITGLCPAVHSEHCRWQHCGGRHLGNAWIQQGREGANSQRQDQECNLGMCSRNPLPKALKVYLRVHGVRQESCVIKRTWCGLGQTPVLSIQSQSLLSKAWSVYWLVPRFTSTAHQLSCLWCFSVLAAITQWTKTLPQGCCSAWEKVDMALEVESRSCWRGNIWLSLSEPLKNRDGKDMAAPETDLSSFGWAIWKV